MPRRLTTVLLALWCLLLAGGQAGLLQGAAWTSMLIRRAQAMPWHEAVATTFDGDHPCALCALAERERERRDPSPTLDHLVKPACAEPSAVVVLPVAPARTFAWKRRPDSRWDGREPRPPTPPPRALMA